MTGAGVASLAFAKEQTFMGSLVDADSDSNPDYWKFGRDPTVTELELDRALQNLSEADQAEYVESVAGNLEGAFAVEAVISSDVHGDVEDLVFNDGGTGFTPGRAASGRVYAGIDYLDGTAERELKGCIPLDYTVSYEQGEPVSYSLTMAYADEELGTSITPSSINSVTDGTSAMFHGVTLDVDGAEVTKLQSAELSISNISRLQRGADHIAVDAVLAKPETELSADAIFTGPSRTELAYGGTGATTTAARMDSVSGSFDVAVDGASVSAYQLANLKPNTHGWNDLITDGDTDTTDTTQFNVTGGVTVA
jgi:molybdopterin biosynthesis enzyme MoaB